MSFHILKVSKYLEILLKQLVCTFLPPHNAIKLVLIFCLPFKEELMHLAV